MYEPVKVKVWGDFALFTMPEMKVERVSYPFMTPSAARGVLDSIFWKPEMHWMIQEIQILKPINYFSILRNEVNSIAYEGTARGWAVNGGNYFADQDRAQRHSLCLRDVSYIISAQAVVHDGVNEDPAKYRDQFRRRVEKGQYKIAPYLGCREFPASFSQVEEKDIPLDVCGDFGRMLFDLDYVKGSSGKGLPRFFNANVEHGVLKIPQELYKREEV